MEMNGTLLIALPKTFIYFEYLKQTFLPFTQIHHSKSMRELHCINICVSAVQPPPTTLSTRTVCGNFKTATTVVAGASDIDEKKSNF